MKKYYSVKRYADMIGKTSQTIYNYIRAGMIDTITVEIGELGKKSYVIVVDEKES